MGITEIEISGENLCVEVAADYKMLDVHFALRNARSAVECKGARYILQNKLMHKKADYRLLSF